MTPFINMSSNESSTRNPYINTTIRTMLLQFTLASSKLMFLFLAMALICSSITAGKTRENEPNTTSSEYSN